MFHVNMFTILQKNTYSLQDFGDLLSYLAAVFFRKVNVRHVFRCFRKNLDISDDNI